MSTALGLGMLLLAWTVVVTLVSGVAVARALGRPRATPMPTMHGRAPRVVVIRPCAGLEPHLRRSLASTASLRYGGPLRVVLATSTANDAARPVMLEVGASLRARGMDVAVEVVAPRGANLKASQLAGIVDEAADDVALVIDSDVELDGLDLDRMLAPLREPAAIGDASGSSPTAAPNAPRVAAVWCPPVEREPVSLGDRMSAALLGGSLHAFPLLGTLDPRGLVGKTFAIRLAALRAVGGFAGLLQHLGEDMELARRLRERGFDIAMSDTPVASLASRRSVAQVLARYTRWLMVIRVQRPALLASYPLLLAATPGLLVVGSCGVALGWPGAGLALGVALVARLAVAMTAARLARRTPRPGAALVDAVLADALLLVAFARALGPARVRWRERSLRLGTHGVLERG